MPVCPQGLSGIFHSGKDQAAMGSERPGTGQQRWLLWGVGLIGFVQPDLSLGIWFLRNVVQPGYYLV